MSYGVCFRRETDRWMQDQWSFLFSNYGITELWERGKTDARGTDFDLYQDTIEIATAAELPNRPLVVLAHQEGRYIQGNENLETFVHPENAIYLFGASMLNMSDEDDLGGRVPDHFVYIPYAGGESYGHAIGYAVLWDRRMKALG